MSARSNTAAKLSSPWREFLQDVDGLLGCSVELHCLGGFVLRVLYNRPIATVDIDCLSVVPHQEQEPLVEIAGQQSQLARKHKVYIQIVTVADYPEDYETRLTEMFPKAFARLRLLSLEAHDLALTKLTRNSRLDQRDVEFLARKGVLDPATLEERYRRELRPSLANQERHDLTLKLWLEDYFGR